MLLEQWMLKERHVRVQLKEGNKSLVGVIASCNEEEIELLISNARCNIAIDHIIMLEPFRDQKLNTDADFDNAYLLGKRVDIYRRGELLVKEAVIQLHGTDFIVVKGKCYDKKKYDVYTDYN